MPDSEVKHGRPGPRPRHVRPHRSLLVRLLAASVTIAVCSVLATTWLTARTTATAVRAEQGQVLADDTSVYRTLLAYAATHPRWDGVQRTVRKLSERTGRRITLTTPDRGRTIARTDGPTAPLADRESAVVDPLHVDAALSPGAPADRIDSRAAGPYLLTAQERENLDRKAEQALDCLHASGLAARIDRRPGGHPYAVIGGGGLYSSKGSQICGVPQLEALTATEDKALDQLSELAGDCLGRHGLAEVAIGPDLTAVTPSAAGDVCVDTARREQLAPYVAPAALLFVDSPPAGPIRTAFRLSPANTARITGVAGLVLLLTVSVTVLVGSRLVRPLRALTEAAMRPGDGRVRVPVTTRDEIGHLATVLNDLSQRRALVEEQRKAMVSDVAHELRTPLSNIRIWLEAVQDGIALSDQAFVSSLLDEALLLQHIIDDLQDLAAADAGALRLHPEPVHVRDLLEQVADAHRARAEAAGIRLDVLAEDNPALTVDPVRLRQAVANLVSNAVRHTPAGGRVTLHTAQAEKDVVIEVADTGTGIAPEDLPLVFDRFWRADKSRNRQTGGSGLGLAIVRQLVAAHGGTADVRSTPGTGSVFVLRLPTAPMKPAPVQPVTDRGRP